MRQLAAIFFGLLAVPVGCLAAAPASGPVAAPATAHADDTPKGVLIAYLHAAEDADAQAALQLVCTRTPEELAQAQGMLEYTFGLMKYTLATGEAFHDPIRSKAKAAWKLQFAALESAILSADVKVNGDTAELTPKGDHKYILARVEGNWKFDFIKTNSSQMNPEAAATFAQIGKIYDDAVKDLAAGKFKTLYEADHALDARLLPYGGFRLLDDEKKKAATEQITTLSKAVEKFKTDTGRYPSTDEGLAALVQAPKGLEANWHGPYIPSVPSDGWGTPFRYLLFGDRGFKVYSAGPDRHGGTPDDVDP